MAQSPLIDSLFIRTLKASMVALVFSVLAMSSTLSFAEDEEAVEINTQYVDLKPAFVANFGAPSSKLKFVKADISVRTNTLEAARLIDLHMPLIRNEIVLILSAQTEDEISSIEGQEALRLTLLEKIRETLKEETGSPAAEDLLFTNFVLQR